VTTWEPMRPVLPVTRMDMMNSGRDWHSPWLREMEGNVLLSAPAGSAWRLVPVTED